VFPSISYYAPYPGSALGFQLIAEGKSKMSKENYHRFPDDEKVIGVDYGFYRELLAGKFDAEVNAGLSPEEQRRGYAGLYAAALTKA
jgi:anaerobic magnesium-protoporphyrin IX monomethyl ester cyclase